MNQLTQGNHLCSTLGCHDRRDARDCQHIALGVAPGRNEVEGRRQHDDTALCHCPSCSDFLVAHIHHPGLALLIEVGKSLAVHRQKPCLKKVKIILAVIVPRGRPPSWTPLGACYNFSRFISSVSLYGQYSLHHAGTRN